MELNTQALVLGTERYTETDMLVFLFTQPSGLLTVRARGARKIHSKAAHTMVAPSLIYVRLVEGKQYPYFTSSEVIEGYTSIKQSYTHLATAFAATRLVRRMVEEQEADVYLFEFLVSYFAALNSSPAHSSNHLKWHRAIFIVQFLTHLGLLADFGQYDTIHSRHVSEHAQREIGKIQHTSTTDLFDTPPTTQTEKIYSGALYFLARQLNTPPTTLARMF